MGFQTLRIASNVSISRIWAAYSSIALLTCKAESRENRWNCWKYRSSLWDTVKFPKFRKRACTGNVHFALATDRTGLHVFEVTRIVFFLYIQIASAVQLHLSELVETQTVYIIGARRLSPLPIIFRSHNRSSRFDEWIELAKAQLILRAVHTLKRSIRPFGIF